MIHPKVVAAGDALLRALHELGQWDCPPLLFLIPDVTEPDGLPVAVPVPVPLTVWESAHPADVLNGISVAITSGALSLDMQAPATPGNTVGAILVTEAHTVQQDDPTPADRAALDAFRQGHRLEEHPDAQEIRVAALVDRSLNSAMVRHVRGADITGEVIEGFTGRIPDAVSRFMTALQATWIANAQTHTPHG